MRVLPSKSRSGSFANDAGKLAKLGLKDGDINYVIQLPFTTSIIAAAQAFPAACTLCHAKELEASGNCQRSSIWAIRT